MTKREYVERNIGMTFDFIRQLIDCPEMIESIPDNTELYFIDKDMPLKTKERIRRQRVTQYKVEHVFEPIGL
ncbi:MAG: hypothetical protein HY096_10600 [Nitrospinae bacterium]|nr:hypothetical protein [Nitrospinota bacterium]